MKKVAQRSSGTDLQGGRQNAHAVQALVQVGVVGPTQEGLPKFQVTSALRAAAKGTHPALLARPEQVAQGRPLAAAFTDTKTGTSQRVQCT